MTMKRTDVAIIGGGPAGRVVVHALHAAQRGLQVTLFKDEEFNVNRCAVPYGINGDKPLQKYQIPNTLVTDFGADLEISRVTGIDPDRHNLTLDNGQQYEYRHLVLATGARPVVPPLPGVELPGVLPVRSLGDLDQLRRRAADARLRKAVVVGGGYIGVEVAVVLREMGFAVTIVEMLPTILSQTTEPEFIDRLGPLLTDSGIELRCGVAVQSFADGNGSLAVILDDGTTLPCDFSVLAVGVRKNTEVAAAAGLAVNRFGIIVDDHLRTSHPDIYAAGDCAAKSSLVSGQATLGEFGTNAVFMAKVVAANIMGGNHTFPGVVNASVTRVFDWGVGAAGLTEAGAMAAGFAVATGHSEVLDKYPMIDGVAKITTKLIFERGSGRLLGGSVMRPGSSVAGDVDFISMALQLKASRSDLLVHQYATHPELAAKPSDNRFVFAARAAQVVG